MGETLLHRYLVLSVNYFELADLSQRFQSLPIGLHFCFADMIDNPLQLTDDFFLIPRQIGGEREKVGLGVG